MEHPPSPSESSTPSRRGSHIDPALFAIPAHPRHVQWWRESLSRIEDDKPQMTITSREIGDTLDVPKEDGTDEHSSLLRSRPSQEEEEEDHITPLEATSPERRSSDSSWVANAEAREESRSSWYLFLLTLSFGGLQIAWAVELSNGSPYLLSLGISKSLLAFVWIAGPLSGTLMQPYIGIKSDRCRSRFGKRRPFMVGGAIATVISLMALGWTREIVSGILHGFGVPKDSQAINTTAIVFAVLMIYVLDFSINAIQAGIRAFIVDNAPTHQQDAANAWASRLIGVGNIVGYLFGYADLPRYLWFFGNTQFKVLCVIASLGLVITLAISCFLISERDPRLEGEPEKENGGVFAFFKTLFLAIRRLPPQIKSICTVQLAAWIGWFPFLFYITTYIGELYVDPIFRDNPNMTDEEVDEAWEHGTRVGTFALMIFAITSFAASVILPWFVASSKPPAETPSTPMTASPAARTPSGSGLFTRQALSPQLAGATDVPDGISIKTMARSTYLRRLSQRLPSLEIRPLTLRRAWMFSHLMFALLTWLTFIAHNTTTATILAALIGIPWALTMWAPFALIAAEVSKREAIRRGLVRPPPTRDGELLAQGEDPSAGADQAGIVLGIHNVAIAAPQIVATLVSSAIFKALQKPRGAVGDDSVAWVLRFGGCCALVAAWLTRRVREEGEEKDQATEEQ